MTDLLAHLAGVCRSGDGWAACCPAHADQHQSLSVRHLDGKWLIKCHAGCDWREIISALGVAESDLFDSPSNGAGGRPIPLDQRATVQPSPTSTSPTNAAAGLTLDQYATAKGLPVDFLKGCGISEFTYDHKPALRMPYLGAAGEPLAVRFRIALEGDRFRWKSGSKPQLYGLHRLAEAREAGTSSWSRASRTVTPSGTTAFPRSACPAPPTGARIVTPSTSTASRRSTSSSSPIAAARPFASGCRSPSSAIASAW